MPDTVRSPRLLDANLQEARRLKPTALSLSLNRRSVSTAQITLPGEDEALPLMGFAEMYLRRGSAGIFRVKETSQAVKGSNTRTYALSHAVSTLHDSVWRAQEDFSGTVTAFLTQLLGYQQTVRWQLGTVQDTGAWKRSGINYDHLDTLLYELAADRKDYLLTFDFSTSPWTLNFVQASGQVDCEMRMRRNLYDAQARGSLEGMCNRLYLTVHSTAQSQEDATVTEPTTQLLTYNDTASQAEFGVIEDTADIDTADVPDVAAWVAAFFQEHAAPQTQTSADGYEVVKSTGEPFDQFDLGKRCRIPALNVEGPVESIRFDSLLSDPDKARLDLNQKQQSATGRLHSLKEQTRAAAASARSAGYAAKKNAADVEKHYNHVVNVTDQGMSDCFSVIGVKIGDDGMPMRDEHGDFVWAGPNDQAAEIWGHLHRNAWTQVIQNHIQDEHGNILSIGQVLTSADGQALITAINDNATGQAQILADRIAIQSTSGSGITFDNQGNISINAGEVVTRINDQSENIIDINADRILIGSNRTLNSILGINSEGGYAYFTGQVGFFNSSQSAASLVTINNGKVNAPTLQVANEGSLIFGALGNNSITLTHQILGSMVRSFSVSGNVLTLTPFVGEAVNFSKATTLTGAWSSGVYTVTATPQGNTESTQIYLGATGNGSSNFSVNTYHDSIAAANIAISDYIYLTEEVAAKTVSAHWHNAQGTVYGVISTQATYNAGWGAAYAKVDLPDPLTELESHDTLTMDVKVPAQTVGTDATTTYALSATQWNGNTAFAKLKAGNDDILRLTLDATPRYRAGSYAVTLNNPDWGTAPNPLTNSRTVSVSTSGRVDSNGTAANLTKSIALYLTQGSFDSAHKLTVSLRDTSSSGTVRAETEVDASGVYSAGQGSVSAGIVDGNNTPVSGQQTLSAGSSITLYPAKYISGAYDSKNTQAAVVVTAGAPSSWINMTSSEIRNADLGPNGLDRVRISNSQSDDGSGAITVNATNYIWLLGSDGNWGVARSVNISANITTSAGNISSSNPYPSATLYGVTQGNYLPISITCGNSTIHIVVKGT